MHISRLVRCSLFALVLLAIPASSFGAVFISVGFAPPALPVYVQPACPGDGYIWTPGYWAYGPDGYYWVPGTWVLAPEPGLLWTPGYWGWGGSAYLWHPGYWGPRVGFYGGINYGYGYFGAGYAGGYWRDRRFYYNRSVNNVTITNVHIYNKTVNNVTVNRVSYNGGHGGVNRRPSHDEERAEREHRVQATSMQVQHENAAKGNRELWVSNNHGRPGIAATARPTDFHGRDVVPAKEGGPAYHPENRNRDNRDNRDMNRDDNRGKNREVPHPNSERGSMDRPARPDNNHGGRPEHNARPENRGPENHAPENRVQENRGPQNRPENRLQENRGPENRPENRGHAESRPNNARPDNSRQHENGPRQEKDNKEHKPH
jgi:WXXGXW repeat (2 copies)